MPRTTPPSLASASFQPIPNIVRQSQAANSEQPLLLCFSHLRWNFVFQRPQHLLSRAARTYRVFFFEEPIFEDGIEPDLRVERSNEGVMVAVPMLPHGLSPAEIDEHLRDLVDGLVADTPAAETVLWYYTPMAMSFSDHLSADVVIYDCMDELSAFRGASPHMRECERKLFAKADIVFTGGMSLYESKRRQHHNVHAFPSSVDAAHFARARRLGAVDPADQADIPHPRVGFFGVVDERMDLDFVREIAELRPDLNFVFIGPVVKIDPASLPQRANIHWLGGKDYKALPDYLAGWDMALMPFALNESTRFISPTKTPEFLAAGKPVVSTAVADVVKPYGTEGLVEIAATPAEAAAAIDKLFRMDRKPWEEKVNRKLASMSWDKTWGEMNQLILAELRPASGLGTSATAGVAARV
ncbi:glycosyltransferase family 1 protein [Devosia albogilva]|uniref:Glycosyltransferase family 1 protein n=1 Tax=Devosia albogilva TaxID=429726 RepID=A0ABW5QL82_9HYPH